MNAIKNVQTTDNSLAQFYTESLKSPELQARLKTATSPETLCQIVVELGAELGCEFTLEQVRTALAIEAALGGEVLEESNLSTNSSSVVAGSDGSGSAPFVAAGSLASCY
jgi:Nif11 domain